MQNIFQKCYSVSLFKITIFGLLLIPAIASALTISTANNWAGIFAGQSAAYAISLSNDQHTAVFLKWRLVAKNRTLAQGQDTIRFAENTSISSHIVLQTPKMKSGVMLKAKLIIDAVDTEHPQLKDHVEAKLGIYSTDLSQFDLLNTDKLNVQLFDPEGQTGQFLTHLQIPYHAISKQQLLNSTATEGLIIVGENIALDQQRGLMQGLIELASLGQKILLLQPKAGTIPLTELAVQQNGQAPELLLRHNSVTNSFAQEYAWDLPSTNNLYGLSLTHHRQAILLQITPYQTGDWSWLQLNYTQSQGQLIVSLLPFNKVINDYPIPQLIFRKLLVYAYTQ
ncbi:MAG: hypothetical protein GQ581_09430 [Methyloprofundus sp.]|nr:hypothetical protein [Methyloprofundus sp.]